MLVNGGMSFAADQRWAGGRDGEICELKFALEQGFVPNMTGEKVDD